MAEPRSLQGPVVLATGGTGGHVFPAEALAGELEARGVPFTLVTDSRGKQWQGALAHRPIHYIHSASPTGSLGRRLMAMMSHRSVGRRRLRWLRLGADHDRCPPAPPALHAP
jgi:UDP-N-acetylglucosamine:LPS N-acetylglucosamine transferase